MSKNQFIYDLPKPKKTVGKRLIDMMQLIVILLALFIVMYLFVFIPNQVDGQSMMPNFHDRELLFTNKIIQLIGEKEYIQKYNYNYQVGDVVIFQKPEHPDFIKRVIGIPGDKIMIQDGFVYRNGKKMIESYIPQDGNYITHTYDFMEEGEVITVPEGFYFLMGDNRNNSKDSRFIDIGFVDRNWIKGKVVLRWWPLNRVGIIERGEIEYEEKSIYN